MRSWRVTIPWLMVLVGACAAWSAWLIRPTFHAASLAFTTMWTVLLVAVLMLRYGRNRAYWFGFVVFGWGYALLAFAPGGWFEVRPYLLSSHPLGDLADALGLTKEDTTMAYHPVVVRDAGLNPWFATVPGERFQRIGHSLAAILHGVAGGLLASFLERRKLRMGTEATDPSRSP